MQLPKFSTISQISIAYFKIYFRISFGPMVWAVITFFLLFCYAVLIAYYYGHFKKLPCFSARSCHPKTFISVIVAARNEEKALPRLLHALSAQTYPPELFEIILVDDFSTDGTAAVAQIFSNPHITVIQPQVPSNVSSKKRAIEAGVQHARGSLLLITDADCLPGKDW